MLGKHIKKPEVATIQHGTKALELQNLKPNVGDVEDRGQTTTTREGKMLVIGKPLVFREQVWANELKVSGYNDIRDQLRDLTREYLQEGVSLVELDYQPK